MKNKIILTFAVFVLVFQSCVPTKQFKDLEKSCHDERMTLREQLQNAEELNKEHASEIFNLNKHINILTQDSIDLSEDLQIKTLELDKLTRQFEALQRENEYLSSGMNNSSKKLLQDFQDLQNQLLEREDILNERESQLLKSQKEIESRNKKIEELNNILAQQSKELKNLKNEVINALKSYDGQGIDIVEKGGKIYVSMDENLLFMSGSYNVAPEGKKAIGKLGTVLAQNPNINVLIEGHTDNVPYNGSGQLKDNWDLSVMRATSVVKILLENKNIDPKRLTATGHGEYQPITSNSTSESRAKNRRTEIVLEPNLQKLFELLEKY
ncbi:MAG: OmpA family protein [Bacteroidales bacterium]|nr:OmpA family protein [Bacteroidales bacterium]